MKPTFTRLGRACGSLLLAVILGSCQDDEVRKATAILVSVQSDLPVGEQFGQIKAAIYDRSGELASEHTFELTTGEPKRGQVRLPFSFGVQKKGANRFTIAVTGYPPGADDNPVVEQRFTVDFKDSKTLGLNVFLSASCYQIVCGDEQSCLTRAMGGTPAGTCSNITRPGLDEVEPGKELPDASAPSEADGGGSGGTDAGLDADAAVEAGSGEAGRSGSGGAGSGGAGSGGAGSGGAGNGGTGGTDDGCGDSCAGDEVCIDGQCHCQPALTPYFRDDDVDGHGDSSAHVCSASGPPTGYVAAGDDCCDLDADAYPGQTAYFTGPTSCSGVGFDYDCDGVITPIYALPAAGNCCVRQPNGDPGWQNGWMATSLPNCGDVQGFQVCIIPEPEDVTTCYVQTTTEVQQCR